MKNGSRNKSVLFLVSVYIISRMWIPRTGNVVGLFLIRPVCRRSVLGSLLAELPGPRIEKITNIHIDR